MLLVAAVVAVPATSVANPHLGAARQALGDLDYDKAQQTLERALLWGKNTPAQMVEIYRLLGEVHAALGQPRDARAQFARMLSIDPDARLPEGSSPKLTRPFDAAREQAAARGPLAVRCEVDAAGPSVRVHIDADPLGLVAGGRAVYRTGQGAGQSSTQSVEARGAGTVTLALPAADGIELYCAAIDERGNHLAEIGSFDEPLRPLVPGAPAALPSADAPSAGASGPGLFGRWSTWGVMTVAAAGAGTYFGLQARADRDELERLNQASMDHDFAEAQEVEDRGRRNALLANIGFGVAGACAVAAVITYLRRPTTSRAAESTAVIAPVFLRRGAAVSVAASF